MISKLDAEKYVEDALRSFAEGRAVTDYDYVVLGLFEVLMFLNPKNYKGVEYLARFYARFFEFRDPEEVEEELEGIVRHIPAYMLDTFTREFEETLRRFREGF